MVLGYNRNEYQEYFLGGKGDRYIHSYQLHVPTISESGYLNLLHTSGPVIGITLPLPIRSACCRNMQPYYLLKNLCNTSIYKHSGLAKVQTAVRFALSAIGPTSWAPAPPLRVHEFTHGHRTRKQIIQFLNFHKPSMYIKHQLQITNIYLLACPQRNVTQSSDRKMVSHCLASASLQFRYTAITQ